MGVTPRHVQYGEIYRGGHIYSPVLQVCGGMYVGKCGLWGPMRFHRSELIGVFLPRDLWCVGGTCLQMITLGIVEIMVEPIHGGVNEKYSNSSKLRSTVQKLSKRGQ